MNLLDDFREIRKKSTPFCYVVSTDYRATIKALSEVRVKMPNGNDEPTPGCVTWDIMRGHRPYNDAGRVVLATFGDDSTEGAPASFLNKAISGDPAVPPGTMLFLIVPSPEIMMDPNVAQAIANIRDPFKNGRRTLVIVAPGLALPPIIKDDMPILTDPLPDTKEIEALIRAVHADTKKDAPDLGPLKEDEVARAVDLCRGLTRFAVEEGIARKLRKTRIDLDGLADMQRLTVEASTNKGLTFLRDKLTFKDAGGLIPLQEYFELLFKGPRPPTLVVFWDEIDKSITSASTGAVADNTGVSQDQLQSWLKAMNDNKWRGILSIGCPGVGKSLSATCVGNTYGVRTLAIDSGASKTSALGDSEARQRMIVDILKSMGGDGVFFIGTANRLDTLPPEFKRRFNRGTWFFDLPTAAEREVIWRIQCKAEGVPLNSTIPPDEGWTGSDIRNCVGVAKECNIPLVKAANFISLTGKSAAADIAKLRDLAERSGFLSANRPGAYRRAEADEARTITV